MARLYSPVPDGPKHLVLCGEPLFQVPVVLPSVLHHEIMSRVWDGEMEERRKRRRLQTMRGVCTQNSGFPAEQRKKTKRQGHTQRRALGRDRSLQRPKTMNISLSLDQTQDLSLRKTSSARARHRNDFQMFELLWCHIFFCSPLEKLCIGWRSAPKLPGCLFF